MAPRVFISSTTKDLAEYRAAAVEVCNRLGLTPVGMEFFGPMEPGATAASLSRLDESDVYVGIVAFRYGHVEKPHRTSVVEAEYRHAGTLGIERLCFLLSEDHPWPRSGIDPDQGRILRFREEIEGERVRELFTSVDDFRARLTSTLVEWRGSRRRADLRTSSQGPERGRHTDVRSRLDARESTRSLDEGDGLPPGRGILRSITRPMLFVGLGGTGRAVGIDLDRQLRREICGLDGTRLLEQMHGFNMLPFELPSCVQFVYADLDAAELARVRRRTVSSREISIAARRTTGVTNLVPSRRATPEVLVHDLRLRGAADVVSWMPDHDPERMPDTLVEGSGGLPALARAALFETMTLDPARIRRRIREAIRRINVSARDLYYLSAGRCQRVDHVDVFVAFSVCGGTGAGTFYDYVHLLADELQSSAKGFTIQTLVMLPSAAGDARPARLNAGAALVDLCRMIDHSSAQPIGFDGAPDNAVFVQHPHDRLGIEAGALEPAVLFGCPGAGVTHASAVASMSAFVLHAIGSDQTDDEVDGAPMARLSGVAEPYRLSSNGIGRRALTTASVVSLALPLQELVEAVTRRLVGEGLAQLDATTESGGAAAATLRDFLVASGLGILVGYPDIIPPDIREAVPSDPVTPALQERADRLVHALHTLPDALRHRIAGMAPYVDTRSVAEGLLRDLDPFGAERLTRGRTDLTTSGITELVDSCQGVVGLEHDADPTRPPRPDELPRRLLTRLRWDDQAVQELVRQQDEWYRRCAREILAAVWNEHRNLFERSWRAFRDELTDVVCGLRTYAAVAPDQAAELVEALLNVTVGSVCVMPFDDAAGFDTFYRRTLREIRDRYAPDLPPEPTTGDLLGAMLARTWPEMYRRAVADEHVEGAIEVAQQAVREVVGEILRPPDQRRPARLPTMEDLLTAAATGRRASRRSEVDLARLRRALSDLLPEELVPEGDAPLQIVVTYPGSTRDDAVESFLSDAIRLPAGGSDSTIFRCRTSDSVVVALTRAEMGITDVPEVRHLLRQWHHACRGAKPEDAVAWRRRLAGDDGYVLLTPGDRALVLQRLLCALWNGQIVPDGPLHDPTSVVVRLGHRRQIAVTWSLGPTSSLSSWGRILQAYEEWILDDEAGVSSAAEALMTTLPDGVVDHDPTEPAQPFLMLVGLAPVELEAVHRGRRGDPESRPPVDDRELRVVEDFWNNTLPHALNRPLDNRRFSLLDLLEMVDKARELGR